MRVALFACETLFHFMVSACLKMRPLACRHVQVLSGPSPLRCKSVRHVVVGGIKGSETKSLSCFFFFFFSFFKCLQPDNSLPESCLYDLVAVVVHHGSG